MPKTRRLLTSFSKGELSPLLEGHPDLASYFEGGKTLENVLLRRQGGLRRAPGTRFIKEVKTSSLDTILLPFEFSVDDAYMLEVGNQYIRVYKNRAAVTTSAGGPQVEIATPFLTADIRSIHFTQSADILFTFHGSYQQRKLSRTSDTSWALSTMTASPPPSFEADTDISGGTVTLTPAATTGASVIFTASAAVFLEADVGRQIIFGSARGVITAFGASGGDTASPNDHVRVDILDAFPDTNPIAAGSWLLRLSPQCTLDPNIKEPVGAQITLVAGANAWRTADVGKYISVYGGLVKITIRDSVTQVRGEILSSLSEAVDANPAAAPAGSWTLEDASWSASRGWPRTGEFFQGRLYQASTTSQPTTKWGSASDDFESYPVGVEADNAVEYTMATRKVNRIEWLADNTALIVGTSGSEHRVTGSGSENALIGGDVIPLNEKVTENGCAGIQPVVSSKRVLFVDRSLRKVLAMGYDVDQGGQDADELTLIAEHITESGIRLGPMAFQKRLDPRLWFVREDGTLVTLTFLPKEKVIGFTRRVTDGTFEAVAVIPEAGGGPDQVWVIVKRTINGTTKRYVEMMEEDHEDLQDRAWTELNTDCAIVVTGITGTSVTGLSHLEAKAVDVVKNGSYIGQKTVSGGAITLDEDLVSGDVLEIGLHYESEVETMRPAVEGMVIEGIPRSWDSVWARFYKTRGGKINGQSYDADSNDIDGDGLLTGDAKATTQEWGTTGRITITQPQPYPMNLLCAFGTLSLGDSD